MVQRRFRPREPTERPKQPGEDRVDVRRNHPSLIPSVSTLQQPAECVDRPHGRVGVRAVGFQNRVEPRYTYQLDPGIPDSVPPSRPGKGVRYPGGGAAIVAVPRRDETAR